MPDRGILPEAQTGPQMIQDLILRYQDCTACRLSQKRQHVVFGAGTVPAPILVVGEAPGEEEDLQGIPFVGRAGKRLWESMQRVGMDRISFYIANTVCCRPPKNRAPFYDEVEACRARFLATVDIVAPKVILTLGATALTALTGKVGISRWRGKELPCAITSTAIPVIPTFHPAYLLEGRLQNPNDANLFDQDLLLAICVAQR